MGRAENVLVFQDTERLCKSIDRLKNAVKNSTSGQKLYLESDSLPYTENNLYNEAARVTVSKKRSLEAAKPYIGCKVAVHNFASATNPGGGVVNGSSAQEECLCRCSGLYFSLNTPAMWDGFYLPHRNAHDPLHNDDIIYTPGVTVFKTDTANPTLMSEDSWYEVDIITCAAPNLREKPGNSYNLGDGSAKAIISDEALLELHKNRLSRILDAAIMNGRDTVILGAFGCGAFENNPEVVALAAKNVIRDYIHAFKNIEFAVYCAPHDERNFKIFERVLKEYC